MSSRINPYIETDPKKLTEHAMDIMVAASAESVFTSFMGEDNDSIIKTEGAKFDGADSVTMSLRAPLRGKGVKGNQNLDTNRDNLEYIHQRVAGDIIANSILSKHKKISSKTIAKNFRTDAKDGMMDWLSDKMDRIRFGRLSEAASNVVGAKSDGTVVDKANIADTTLGLTSGDKFSTSTIDEMLKRAENGYTDTAGKRHPKVRPFKTEIKNVKGVPTKVGYYLILVGTESEDSLGKDPIYIQAQEALTTADKSTFFTDGQVGQYKNAIIVKKSNWCYENAGIVTSDMDDFEDYAGGFSQYAGKGGIVTEVNLLLGATAGMQPFQHIPDYIEDSADAGRKIEVAVDEWFGFEKTHYIGKTVEEKKLIWHDVDYGVIVGLGTVE